VPCFLAVASLLGEPKTTFLRPKTNEAFPGAVVLTVEIGR